jgi:hypothetical protein
MYTLVDDVIWKIFDILMRHNDYDASCYGSFGSVCHKYRNHLKDNFGTLYCVLARCPMSVWPAALFLPEEMQWNGLFAANIDALDNEWKKVRNDKDRWSNRRYNKLRKYRNDLLGSMWEQIGLAKGYLRMREEYWCLGVGKETATLYPF